MKNAYYIVNFHFSAMCSMQNLRYYKSSNCGFVTDVDKTGRVLSALWSDMLHENLRKLIVSNVL